MSCDGGLSTILTLDVPVTDNTEGLPTDVSGVIGPKTIEISGNYIGAYTILGSNDGLGYSPVLTFQSGSGPQATKQTLPFVLQFMKVRRRALISEPVAISIASKLTCSC